MSTITISLSDDRLKKLQERAVQYQVAPEDLVRASIEELLMRPEDDFEQALNYVLNKNKELYQRLA
jgi:predicted transcriptional regulator